LSKPKNQAFLLRTILSLLIRFAAMAGVPDFLEVKLSTKLEQIQSRIDYYEDKINKLVYQLYELTEEEIEIVENSTK